MTRTLLSSRFLEWLELKIWKPDMSTGGGQYWIIELWMIILIKHGDVMHNINNKMRNYGIINNKNVNRPIYFAFAMRRRKRT